MSGESATQESIKKLKRSGVARKALFDIEPLPRDTLVGRYHHYLAIRTPKRKLGEHAIRARLQSLMNHSERGVSDDNDLCRAAAEKLSLAKNEVLFVGINFDDLDMKGIGKSGDRFADVAHAVHFLNAELGAAWLQAAARCGNMDAIEACKEIDDALEAKGIRLKQKSMDEWVKVFFKLLGLDKFENVVVTLRGEVARHIRMGKSTKPRVKALNDGIVCAAELKKTKRLTMWPEVIKQISLGQVDDSMFHDRCSRLAVSSPATATAYLWWAQLQCVPNAAIAWRWLKHRLFGTVDDEIIEALSAAFTAIKHTPDNSWRLLNRDLIETKGVSKVGLGDDLKELVKKFFLVTAEDIDAAMSGDVKAALQVISEFVMQSPVQAFLLCRMYTLMSHVEFVALEKLMMSRWYQVGFSDTHDADAVVPTPDDVINDKWITKRPSEVQDTVARNLVCVAPELIDPDGPNTKHIAGADRRNGLRPYQALRNGLHLREADPEPDQLRAMLVAEFPWMTKTIDIVHRDMTVRQAYGQTAFLMPPLLLVGPPGNGKTRFCQRLAALVGVPFNALSLAGAADDRMLRGTGAGWSTATPCFPIIKMNDSKCANPMILLDEIEKAKADGRNGDPHATLLTFLEPENARGYLDEALMTNVDISMVNWIATANSLDGLPSPLLSRLRVVQVPQPTAGDVVAIIRGVRADFAREVDVDVRFVPELEEAEIMYLEKEFGKRPNVRVLIRMVERLIHRREILARERPH